MNRLQTYETAGITVTFDPNLCTHAAACVRGLPAVFDVSRKRWIRPELAAAAEVAAQVGRCPSGALQFRYPSEVMSAAGSSPPAPPMAQPELTRDAQSPLHDDATNS